MLKKYLLIGALLLACNLNTFATSYVPAKLLNNKLEKTVLNNLDKIRESVDGQKIRIQASTIKCIATGSIELQIGTCSVKGDYPYAGGPNEAVFSINVSVNDEGINTFRVVELASWD